MKNEYFTEREKHKKSGLGIFVAGYRWSGSGAVSDWLAGHSDLCRVKESEEAYGEIRALNYGVRFLLLTATGEIPFGEMLGRWALCPDQKMWARVLGTPLSMERGLFSIIYYLLDVLYFSAARFRIIPPVSKYKDLLDAQLGGDFRSDEEYLVMVTQLSETLRDFARRQRKQGLKPERDETLRIAVSQLVSLFARRIQTGKQILIFDNAISGMYPEFFKLLHPEVFPGQIIIFVRRDPRDQFADLLKYSGSTFPWSVGKFIRQYRQAQEKTERFVEEATALDHDESCNRFIRQVTFEDFVLNKNGTRDRLQDELQDFWQQFDVRRLPKWKESHPGDSVNDGMNGLFNAESSRTNIGIWTSANLSRQMLRISRELSDYIKY